MYTIFGKTVLILLVITFFSCKGDEGEITPNLNKVIITVKTADGTTMPHTKVYIFENPSTSSEGKNPSFSLRSGITDAAGVAEISLSGYPDLSNEPTAYFTVLETNLAGEYNVLGSTALQLVKGSSTLSTEVIIGERSLSYPFGFMTTVFDSQLAKQEYNRWKNTQVVGCGDGLRVVADPYNETRVEAIGFGTILSAYANDKETFDGLMAFYESKRTTAANNLMAWLVTCNDIQDPGCATDGDIDVAFANIVAYKQWGGDYLDKALEILDIIKNTLILDCTVDNATTKVLAPGYSNGHWGGCQMTDIQYYTPGFFRVFAEVTGDNIWEQLADDSYVLLNASANPSTGLVPDWQTAEGDPGPGGREGRFRYDACRVPWRMSLDYLWNGNEQSRQWCNKITNWAYSIGPGNIVDGYELDGTPFGTYHNSAFLGGFTVAMMTNDFEKLNEFADALDGLNDTYWFNLNTRVIYLFALSGNMWRPEF